MGLPKEITQEHFELPENEALEFVRHLKIGWNLGDTFDAIDCDSYVNDELEYETAWRGVKTTKRHIEMVKEAGFRTVRLPVSWHNHVSDGENYTISAAWLERVAEVVDYCISLDLYVILNIHHDNNQEFLYPTKEDCDRSVSYVTAVWKQLAGRFQEYDEHMIFGCMNEPRLVGHANEWHLDESVAECREAVDCINKINQAFVDTVRASGGNNRTRYLICPGYAASADGALSNSFRIPTDPANPSSRVIVSVHAYTPYHFALEDGGTDEWSGENAQDVADMVGFMDRLYEKYTGRGIPVLLDEFGARNKKGNLAARKDFGACYVAAARKRGMSCCWWDNNALEGDGELFGLLDREKYEWAFPEIVQGMMEGLESVEE